MSQYIDLSDRLFNRGKSNTCTRLDRSEAEWAHVLQCLAQTPAGAARTRLRGILEVLVSSGIRLDELAKATHADLRLESLPGLPDTWVLQVTGKRDKQRDAVELLNAHALEFATSDKEAEQQAQDQTRLPLIRALEATVEQHCRRLASTR